MRFCEAPEGCKYPVFSTDKITRKGYCRSHATKYRTDLDRRSIIQKAMAKQKALSTKVRGLQNDPNNLALLEEKGIVKDNNLELWFLMVANEIKKDPHCWETGEYISEKDYRNASAHIFPKSIFKSISTHPLNFLILSPRNGSHDKTHRLDTFSKMKVWKLAVERFKVFEPLITEKHKYLNLFKEYALSPSEQSMSRNEPNNQQSEGNED